MDCSSGMIRMVRPEDSDALRAIYAQYMDTPITFEYQLPSQAAFADRIAGIMQEYPYLVWEEAGRALGYAYAHRQMERAAYQWNAELSIYLDPGTAGRGIGRRMYGALIELLRLQGIRNVYAGVTLPNRRSEGLHREMGFHLLGVYHRTGYKNGCWHDVGWYKKELLCATAEDPPRRPVAFPELPAEQVQAVLLGSTPNKLD